MKHEATETDKDCQGLASRIETLNLRAQSGEAVSLGDALDYSGARIHGAAILLMSLPESIPLPIPSVGAILGIPLIITSAHLTVFGEGSNLPDRARRIRIPPRMIALMARLLTGPLARAERLSHTRLAAFSRRERLIGAVCTLMSVLLLLPVPLMNVPPAIVLVCLSWGLLQRDGLFIAIGIAMAVGVAMSVFILGDLMIGALGAVGTP
jgi:hypothetical protein